MPGKQPLYLSTRAIRRGITWRTGNSLSLSESTPAGVSSASKTRTTRQQFSTTSGSSNLSIGSRRVAGSEDITAVFRQASRTSGSRSYLPNSHYRWSPRLSAPPARQRAVRSNGFNPSNCSNQNLLTFLANYSQRSLRMLNNRLGSAIGFWLNYSARHCNLLVNLGST
jgi:hypothetical protein